MQWAPSTDCTLYVSEDILLTETFPGQQRFHGGEI